MIVDVETSSTKCLKQVGYMEYAESCSIVCAVLDRGGGAEVFLGHIDSDMDKLGDILRSYEGHIYAYNAPFDEAVLSYRFGLELDFLCVQRIRASCGYLYASLEKTAQQYLGEGKHKEGGRLLKEYLVAKDVKASDIPAEDLDLIVEYCKRDVFLAAKLLEQSRYYVNDIEGIYELDRHINRTGIPINIERARKLLACLEENRRRAVEAEQIALEGANPRSNPQMIAWFARLGIETDKVSRPVLEGILEKGNLTSAQRDSVAIILKSRCTLTAKLRRIIDAIDADGRLRNCYVYYGCVTGRWSSRQRNVQNLHRPTLGREEIAEAVAKNNFEDYETAKSCLRAVIEPKRGSFLVVGDLSGIEPRVLNWIIGDTRALKMLAEKDYYKVVASEIYVKREQDVTYTERQLTKTLVLGVCYGMGLHALSRKLDLTLYKARALLARFSTSFPNLANFRLFTRKVLSSYERAQDTAEVGFKMKFSLSMEKGALYVRLPSGRYYTARGQRLTDLYGDKLLQNLVQAVARDVIAEAMKRVGDPLVIIGHTHDEIICEVSRSAMDEEEAIEMLREVMITTPDWATGLPLKADVHSCVFYGK